MTVSLHDQISASESKRKLVSWKAIASYFDCNESTVKRWERERALPVHRIPGGKRSAVFANIDEIESWLASGMIRKGENEAKDASDAKTIQESKSESMSIPLGREALENGLEEGPSPTETPLRTRSLFRRWLMRAAAYRVFILAVIGVVSLFFAYRVISSKLETSRVPAIARIDGEMVELLNSDGVVLWKKFFPEGFWGDFYEEGVGRRTWIGDLEGNGQTSVLLLYHPAVEPLAHTTTLICYSSSGQEKWRWMPGRPLPELGDTPQYFITNGFAVLKSASGRPHRIVVSSHNQPFFPHQIAVVDDRGRTISEYWHSGVLEGYFGVADLDGDGREEIVATGISNGYRQATLVVLDSDRIFGASRETARPELQIHGMGFAQERIRILFPRSDINRDLSVYNKAMQVTFTPKSLLVSVTECYLLPRCSVLYELDHRFRLVSFTPDDQFRNAHRQFYFSGKNAHVFTRAEEAQFRKIRCLSGCSSEFLADIIQDK
jgi:hypothetical protein